MNVPVRFSNIGTVAAASVSYRVALSGAATGITVSYGGAACAYDNGTGAVTGCGLPSTLSPGQAVDLALSYTAPATGPVVVTSTVATTTAESNSANNTANASTALAPAPAPDMAISLAGLPATATVGVGYSGTFSCSNIGNASAASGTACSVSGLTAGVAVGACTISPSGAVWTAGASVPVGQTVTCTMTGTPTTVGNATITGTTGATGDANATNNSATKQLTVGAAAQAGAQAIPTLSEWAAIALSGLIAGFGLMRLRPRPRKGAGRG